MSNELTTYFAARLTQLMRGREVSPVEVLEAHLRRCESLNGRLNAVVAFAPDAMERAREAEQAIMRGGDDLPPLLGLPVTVKDTIDTAGLLTTRGSRAFADNVPAQDAPSVARLRAAGAIIYGKTNTSELALDYTAENPVFGRTVNPHDEARTPGGSSGGCAAAVAACLTPASLASDMTGSIRVPAHFCGVAGLKPTVGVVPAAGHFPPTEGACSLAASLGPIARQVDDLALLFDALANPDRRLRRLSRGEEAPSGLRAAFYTDDGLTPVTDETKAAVESAARSLSEAGYVVSEARPPGVERAPDLWRALFARPVRGVVRGVYAGRGELAGAAARALLERGESPAQTLDEYFAAWLERDRLLARLLAWMEGAPLLVAPVGATPAFEHGARKVEIRGRTVSLFRAFGYAQTFNVFGLPAACVPAGRTREGLPVGVQIVGRPFAEASVLAAARVVEAASGGWQPPKLALPTAGGNQI
jgi:amidase